MSTQSISIKYGGKTCILQKILPDGSYLYPQAAEKANSYYCPLGPEPGRAWVLMLRKDIDALGDLTLDTPRALEFIAGGKRAKFPSMYFRQAVNVSGSVPGIRDRCYLVELVDIRHFYYLFGEPLDKQYNVRCAGPVGSQDELEASTALTYYASSTSYTWQTMVDNIWAKLSLSPSLALPTGSSSLLPYTPHGTPEGFIFVGVNSWHALHEILKKLSCTTAYDPFLHKFSIVRLGATQAGLSAAEAKYPLRLDDADVIESEANIPNQIRVYFSRRYKHYGTERTIHAESPPVGANNWASLPATSVNVATGKGQGILAVWDDLPAIQTIPIAIENQTDLDARAAEVAAKLLADLEQPKARRLYQGAATEFVPGSEVKAVCWRNYGDGMVTEVVKHPGLPWFDAKRPALATSYPVHQESLLPPDIARRTYPVYPPHDHFVQVMETIGQETNSELVGPEPVTGWFKGAVLRYNPAEDQFRYDALCWILVATFTPAASNPQESGTALSFQCPALIKGMILQARLFGSEAPAGESWNTRPLFVVENPIHQHLAELNGSLSPGGTTTALLYDEDGTASDINVDVYTWHTPKAATGTPSYAAGDRVFINLIRNRWIVVAGPPV